MYSKLCASMLTLAAALLGQVSAGAAQPPPPGDINGDYVVDYLDLDMMTDQWMTLPATSGVGSAELNGVGVVDSSDFAILAANWGTDARVFLLVLNEFMASNDTGHQDPQGDHDDWIEVHNPTPVPIDLGGLYITDNLGLPTKWMIPTNAPGTTTVPAGGYLVLYADEDTTDGALHLGFKLSQGGEDLGLFASDGTTAIDTLSYVEQVTDQSSGRYPNATGPTWFLSTYTPGAANTSATAEAPVFSRTTQLFRNNFSLVLTEPSGSGQIRYTTNGSVPHSGSTLYSGAIPINGTTRIRARTFASGLAASSIVTHTFVKRDSDLDGFSSDLPIVVVDSFGSNIPDWPPDAAYIPTCAIFIETNQGGRASIDDTADFAGIAGMHVRGHSSRFWPKQQYKIELWGEDSDDLSASLLGMPADSDWVLYAPWSDKTMIRNIISYKWHADLGDQYTVRTRYVEVFINENGGDVQMNNLNNVSSSDPYNYPGDYRGVYALTEFIKAGPDRIDIEVVDPNDNTGDEVTGGYIITREQSDRGWGEWSDPSFSAGGVGGWRFQAPKPEAVTSQQQNWLISYMDATASALSTPNYGNYIDPLSFINYRIVVDLAKEIDEFAFSTYWYKDRLGKMNWGPIWDYNVTYGNHTDANAGSTSGWQWSKTGPWWGPLFNQDAFDLAYADRYFQARKDVLDRDRLLADIDAHAAYLDEAQARNFQRWPVLGVALPFNPTSWNGITTYQGHVDWMKSWVQTRLAWLDLNSGYTPPPPVIYLNGAPSGGGYAQAGDSVTIAAAAGTVYYTTDGSDPMIPAGALVTNTLAFVTESAAKKVLIPATDIGTDWKGGSEPFDDSGWNSATFISGKTGGVGYDTGTGYDPYISYDVEDMRNYRASCYVRIPFVLSAGDLAGLTKLDLNLRYEDGFVAYINGVEAAWANKPSPLLWNSTSSSERSDEAAAVMLQNFDVSARIADLQVGTNILAFQVMNWNQGSSDLLLSAELATSEITTSGGTGGIPYSGAISIDGPTLIKARFQNGGTWSAINIAPFAFAPVSNDLRVTEVMYHPADDGPGLAGSEYIELQNTGSSPINLRWCRFSNGVQFTFPDMDLAAGALCVVAVDTNAFAATYGSGPVLAGQYEGRLDNSGERLTLEDPAGSVIQSFRYSDNWRRTTDGDGFSLTSIDPASANLDLWAEKDGWRPSAYLGGSPGADDTGLVPDPGAVIINELIAHTDSYPNDRVELYNTTSSAIDIGGWFLSDSKDNLKKYQFASPTSIPAGGYLVLTQDDHFGAGASDPGSLVSFALSESGETLYLSSGEGANLTGYAEQEDFGASDNGVSFGKHQKSIGTFNFVAMSTPTWGAANALPKVGPVVISEIMYHPSDLGGSSWDKDHYEYIKLTNTSGSPVTLFDAPSSEPWRFTDAIDYVFPASPVTLNAGASLYVVKAPPAFNARFSAGGAQVLGPYEGNLSNGGEKLELSKPGDLDTSGERQYIRVDRVNYSDGYQHGDFPSGTDPWPTAADGNGSSLIRIGNSTYGNDPANWQASP